MKKLYILAALCLFSAVSYTHADDNAFFRIGPLALNVPFKSADVVYLFNGLGESTERSLVGGETTVATIWDKVSGTVGVVTSPTGAGTFFVGADINIGNSLDRFLSLGPIRVGGFGGYDARNDAWMAGPKASIALW
jgi:hypothetical protein